MSWQNLHWTQRLDVLSSQFGQNGGIPSGAYGMTLDQATAPWSAASPTLGSQFLYDLDQQQQILQGPYGTGGAREPGHWYDFAAPTLNALAWPYRMLSSRIISPVTHIVPTIFSKEFQEQIDASSTWDTLFDGRTWSEIQKQGREDSLGRGLMLSAKILDRGANLQNFDDLGNFTYTEDERKEWTSGKRFNMLSGLTDFTAVMFLDPLYVGGKLASKAGLFKTTKPLRVANADDIDNIIDAEPTTRFLGWTDGRTADQIVKHPMVRSSPQAGLIADLLAHAKPADKPLILRISMGDNAAMEQLRLQAPAIANQYQRLKGSVNYYQRVILPSISGLSKEERAARLAPHMAGLERFGVDNNTLLQLNKTEFNPRQLTFDQPFAPRWLGRDEIGVYSSFSIAYRPLADGQERLLFNASGEIERTPLDLRRALGEYDNYRRATRQSRMDRAQALRTAGAAQEPKLADNLTGPALTRDRLPGQKPLPGMPRQTTLRRTGPARVPVADVRAALNRAGIPRSGAAELRAYERGEIDFRTLTDRLAAKPKIKADPNVMGEIRAMLASGPNRAPGRPWQPIRYEPAEVGRFSEQVTGQLKLIDDKVNPELVQLDGTTAWYRRLVNQGEDANRVGLSGTGIYRSNEVVAKGGIYPALAEARAGVAHKLDSATSRGGHTAALAAQAASDAAEVRTRRNAGTVIHTAWGARPVQYLAKIQQSVGRGMTPTTYQAAKPDGWKDVDSWLKRVRGLPPGVRQAYVREMMGATTEVQKLQLLERIEANVIGHMLRQHGVSDVQTIEEIAHATLGTRKAYIGRMADQSLASAEEGMRGSTTGFTGVRAVTLAADGTAIVPGPQLASQLMNEHPLLPIEDLDRAFRRDRSLLQGLGGPRAKDIVTEFSSVANTIWKNAVLFRGGYPIRTVSDEVLLGAAALGSLMYFAGAVTGAGRMVGNLPTKLRNAATRGEAAVARRHRRLPEGEIRDLPYRRGYGPVPLAQGVNARGLLDTPNGDFTRALISTDQRNLWGINDDLLMQFRDTGNWGALDPNDFNKWAPALVHVLNNTLGRDILARQFLRGATETEALKWLNTSQGAQYLRRMPLANARREDWVRGVAAMVDQYVHRSDELAQLALEGKVTLKHVRAIPEDIRMPVHGGQVEYATGQGHLAGWLNSVASSWYNFAAKMPTDTLVRHPVADHLYQRKLRELAANVEGQGTLLRRSPDDLYHLEEVARQYTVKEMDRIFKDNLFSSPQAGLRFIFPFFGAWRASIARWASMIGEDPSIISRANQGWQGLHKPFDVVDENGLPVEDWRVDDKGKRVDQYILDAQGELVKNPAWDKAKAHDSDKDIYGFNTKNAIVVRLPKPIAKAFGALPFIPSGTEEYAPGRAIPLRSFNTVLQGDPWYNAGFGPWVTIPVASIVRGNPQLSKVAEKAGVLPFGPGESWKDLALPAYAQKAMTTGEGLDNRDYANTFVNILRVQTARWKRGERDKAPTPAEIHQMAGDLTKLRSVESWFQPVSMKPVYYSKDWEGGDTDGLQYLLAKFQDYRSRLGQEAGESLFLNEHPEAFLYMESISNNKSKIPASFSGWAKSQAVKDLARVTPDIFDSAAGIQNHDYEKFDSAVYDAQINRVWNTDTGAKYRSTKSPEELAGFLRTGEARNGWRMYGQFMDYLRNELDKRGLVSLTQPQAADLAGMRQKAVEYLTSINPAWAEEHSKVDPTVFKRRLEQAAIVAVDKRLNSDPHRASELQALRMYLEGRRYIVQQLQRRKELGGNITLTARSNVDLLNTWDKMRDYLGQDTRFGEIWLDRYFANDYLQEVS